MQEQVARAAVGFFDAMKGQPLSLALVVMNLALLGMLYVENASADKQHTHDLDLLYKNRHEVAILLTRCNWPEGKPLPKEFNEDAK